MVWSEFKLTFKISKKNNVATPSNVSYSLISSIWEKSTLHESIKSPDDLTVKPKNDLICPLAIVIAAAVVKPTVTGYDINCIKNPKFNKLSNKMTIPLKNDANTAKSGEAVTYFCTIIAIMAVGPIFNQQMN